jgi:hypothetical protein
MDEIRDWQKRLLEVEFYPETEEKAYAKRKQTIQLSVHPINRQR